jgi:hypothetical protein
VPSVKARAAVHEVAALSNRRHSLKTDLALLKALLALNLLGVAVLYNDLHD